MSVHLRRLPKKWWFFLPIWLWLPAFLGIITLVVRLNLWAGFFAACVYMLLTLLVYVPIRTNAMSTTQAVFWVGIGTVVFGIPGLALVCLTLAKI